MKCLGNLHGIPVCCREFHIPLIADKALLELVNEFHAAVGVEEQPEATLNIVDAHLLSLSLLTHEMRGRDDVAGVA